MPLLYGEGERAFIRLQEEIMKDSDDHTLFAWESPKIAPGRPSGLLAQSPSDFERSRSIIPFRFLEDVAPITVTNRGIKLEAPLIVRQSAKDVGTHTLILQCRDINHIEPALLGISLIATTDGYNQFMRSGPLLKRNISFLGSYGNIPKTIYVMKHLTARGDAGMRMSGQSLSECKTFDQTDITRGFGRYLSKQQGKSNGKIILCFDRRSGLGGVDARRNSNIQKIFRMLGDDGESQVSYYQSIGGEDEDVEACVKATYQWLEGRVNSFSNVQQEIFIFGFSTGAHVAHWVARMLENIGIVGVNRVFLTRQGVPEWERAWKAYQAWEVYQAWELYQAWNDRATKVSNAKDRWEERFQYFKMKDFGQKRCKPVRIAFLGLFDTVIRKPESNLKKGKHSAPRVPVSNRAHIIRHAVSIDEQQAASHPSLVGEVITIDHHNQDVQEVWFTGGHADIGGVAPKARGESWDLSHIPLVWMAREAQKAGLCFNQDILRQELGLLRHTSSTKDAESVFLGKGLKKLLYSASRRAPLHRHFDVNNEPSPQSMSGYHRPFPIRMSLSDMLTLGNSLDGNPRCIPINAQLHASVINRMYHERDYRPENWISDVEEDSRSRVKLHETEHKWKLRGDSTVGGYYVYDRKHSK
ncbi:hypothetical protein AWENTII_000710 [Aspergillus wentii]